MNKIIIEPSKLEHILRVGLLSDGKSLLEQVPVTFKENGLSIKDRSYSSVVTVAAFKTSYFKEYDVKEEQVVVLTKTLFDKLKLFKNEEELTVSISEDKFKLQSQNISYEEDLLEDTGQDFGIEMEKVDFGVIPKKVNTDGYPIQFDIDSTHLATLPDSEQFCIYTEEQYGDSILIEIEDRGKTNMFLSVEQFQKFEVFEQSFTGKVFSKLASNLTGTINVIVDDTGIIINQKHPDYVLMYGQASQAEKRTVEVTN